MQPNRCPKRFRKGLIHVLRWTTSKDMQKCNTVKPVCEAAPLSFSTFVFVPIFQINLMQNLFLLRSKLVIKAAPLILSVFEYSDGNCNWSHDFKYSIYCSVHMFPNTSGYILINVCIQCKQGDVIEVFYSVIYLVHNMPIGCHIRLFIKL